MGWKNLNYSWKGVVIGGVVALISSFVMVLYLLIYLKRVDLESFLVLIAFLTLLKLLWGVIVGFFVGSFF